VSLTLIITRDVEDRYRGFLGSLLLEVAAGVYVGPRLAKGTRERVAKVLADWHGTLGRGSITMVWRAAGEPGGIGLLNWGEPPKAIGEADGLLLVRRALRPSAEEAFSKVT